jgi:HAD superfamily hydrolase (TIGR01490 family)
MFDLDNTLLKGDSDHAWGEFLVGKALVDATVYKEANDRFYSQYKDGSLDIHEFLSFTLQALSQFSPTQLRELHEEFMNVKIMNMILPKAVKLIDLHRKRGDKLMIITATNRFVTAPIAAYFNIDTLLASEPEVVDGHYTGRLLGVPCYRAGKIDNLNAWLSTNPDFNLDNSYFYSDSHNDIPLLSLVTYPIAVDADDTLVEYAEKNGWVVISLRD